MAENAAEIVIRPQGQAEQQAEQTAEQAKKRRKPCLPKFCSQALKIMFLNSIRKRRWMKPWLRISGASPSSRK